MTFGKKYVDFGGMLTPSAATALTCVTSGEYDLGFFLRPTPVTQVRAVAAEGVSMPPKSTYYFPKVITGMLFNPQDDPR